MGAQIITTPSGERMVVLPEAEFLAMQEAAEDAADIRACDEAKRQLAAGEDELVPAEIIAAFPPAILLSRPISAQPIFRRSRQASATAALKPSRR